MQIFSQVCRFYIWRTDVLLTSNEVQYNVSPQKHITPHSHVSYSYQGICIYFDNFYTIGKGKQNVSGGTAYSYSDSMATYFGKCAENLGAASEQNIICVATENLLSFLY